MSKRKKAERKQNIEDKPVWAVVFHDEWDHTKYLVTDAMTFRQAQMELDKIDTKDDNEISYHSIEQVEHAR